MPRGEFVRLLICRDRAGIVSRDLIMETVWLAANGDACGGAAAASADLEDARAEFGGADVKRVLSQGQDPRAADHLWWVDTERVYHRTDGLSLARDRAARYFMCSV